ncbi:hypothetical protein AM500_21230 [Bacillus sp. FJAT-18017]|uniref:hypothetical protein n=1 Tax=unclassified Bacillus (in: firmicutes) TaxID=185979 RepID=UPI0005C6C6F4|nr:MULTISPECIES: hypothetical protein [unclassified Bacillus (in: firmicutes)]ALC92033.1 hypothetical protein AM500_21230 [Bacillus sp. FJAT-18017]
MKVQYEFEKDLLLINEEQDGEDVVFTIETWDSAVLGKIDQVRDFFYHNDDLLDAFFHTSLDGKIMVALKQEYYIDFLFQMFKHKLINSIRWQ